MEVQESDHRVPLLGSDQSRAGWFKTLMVVGKQLFLTLVVWEFCTSCPTPSSEKMTQPGWWGSLAWISAFMKPHLLQMLSMVERAVPVMDQTTNCIIVGM